MSSQSSSARPAELDRYARLAAALAQDMERAARTITTAHADFARRCAEYPCPSAAQVAPRLRGLSRREDDLAIWLRQVARAFRQSDEAAARAALTELLGGPAGRSAAIEAIAGVAAAHIRLAGAPLGSYLRSMSQTAWNLLALRLLGLATSIRLTLAANGGSLAAAGPELAPMLAPLAHALVDLLVLLGLGDSVDIAVYARLAPDQLPAVLTQAFWDLAFQQVDSRLLQSLAAEVDAIHRLVADDLGLRPVARPPALLGPDGAPLDGAAELAIPGTGRLAVTVAQAFPPELTVTRPDGQLGLRPGALMAGDHSMISYYQGEQVSLARVSRDGYLISICGLDPENMAGDPNGLEAVIQTSQGERAQNAYYHEVRARFLGYLAQIPPGSDLNLAGHSMGGGMSLLLLSDPRVQHALSAREIHVASVVTLGAVRPAAPAAHSVLPDQATPAARQLYADTVELHYVNQDDRLAANVGAGHSPLLFPGVVPIRDERVDDPVAAHLSYSSINGSGLDEAHALLPFVVDPDYFALYVRTPPPLSPTPIEPPLPILAGA